MKLDNLFMSPERYYWNKGFNEGLYLLRNIIVEYGYKSGDRIEMDINYLDKLIERVEKRHNGGIL